MVRSLSSLGHMLGMTAFYMPFWEVRACVWNCPTRCTSIARATLLGYGYSLPSFSNIVDTSRTWRMMEKRINLDTLTTLCRRNLVDSPPKGMPMVVDESVEVRVRKPDGDTERKRQRLDRFGPSAWRNTLRHVSLWIILRMIRRKCGGPYPPYIARG